jgi:FMN-dependent oxidoreductase (nitrilotriacetate monooxygenase family)
LVDSTGIHLAVDLSFYHTDFVWRQPGGWQGHRYYGPEFYKDIARLAARGVFDLAFFGEAAETPENYGGTHDAAVRWGMRWPKHDMTPMIPLMADSAPGLGFGMTMSTTYHNPFHVARLFASMDWVTGGRMAWNSVTSGYKNEGANWGFDTLLPKDVRYAMAHEHMEVVAKLWDSVEQDAIIYDRVTGEFADPSKVHLIHHKGEHFSVRGPLPVMPSPQGRPVIIQAGQSPAGLDLAGRHAEMQFAINRTVESMREHREGLDAALIRHGRDPRDCGVLWSVRAKVGTQADLEEANRRFVESLPPHAGMIMLSNLLGVDFSKVDGRTPLGEMLEQVREQQGHYGFFLDAVETSGPDTTVEEFGRTYLTDQAATVVGTPAQIVDQLEEMHEATDKNGGFILEGCIAAPDELREFVEFVVPELQRRGLSKTQYAGATLRENLNA